MKLILKCKRCKGISKLDLTLFSLEHRNRLMKIAMNGDAGYCLDCMKLKEVRIAISREIQGI